MRLTRLLAALAFVVVALAGCSIGLPSATTPSAATASESDQPTESSPTGVPSATPVSPATGGSGVAGRTIVDGGCPVEREASPCPEKPISARITASTAGRVVARGTSDGDGRFRISLPPGSYVLHAVNLTGGLYPRSAPMNVTVRSGRYTAVTVSFDSGIQ